jgi:hypothetical protein
MDLRARSQQDHREKKLDSTSFRDIFEKCKEKVENNPKSVRMRELEIDLKLKGEELKKRLLQFCR